MTRFKLTAGGYYRSPTSILTGDLRIGELCSFWFGAVVRGDVATITIGRRVNIQDNAVVHCDRGFPMIIEDDVTVGHGAIVHGVFVGKGSLIGMGATLLGKSVVGSNCMVAAGALVPPGMKIPDGMLAMGVPAKIVRAVTEEEKKYTEYLTQNYISQAKKYEAGEFSRDEDE